MLLHREEATRADEDPVFHDDQHGTAIVVGAAILNGLTCLGKDLKQVKLVTSGAGAAALACLDLLVMLGVPVENIWVTDIKGVVHEGRVEEMDEIKARYAKKRMPVPSAKSSKGPTYSSGSPRVAY